MKRLRIFSLLLVVCLTAGFIPAAAIAETSYSTLSGVLSLPNGDTAPTGGVKITLNVYTDNATPSNEKDDVSFSRTLTIPKGEKSLSYSVMVPKSANRNAGFSVSYYTVENGYAPFGYYSSKGTTAIKAEQTLIKLNEGDKRGINIGLLPGKSISGKIILGNTKTAPSEEMFFTVTAVQEGSNARSTDDDIIINKEVKVKKGKTETDYVLTVPLNKAGSGYKVYYTYKDGTYSETGYYHKNGTTRNAGRVTLIDVGNTVTGINLTTLPFTNISGKVMLPDKDKAPKDGIEVEVKAYNNGSLTADSDDFYISRTVKIAKDASSKSYTMTVPVKDTGYVVSYEVDKKTGYVAAGYYSKNGTQSSKSRASAVNADEKAVSGIDLTLLKTAKPTPTPTPAPKPTPKPKPAPKPKPNPDDKYDINGDGSIDVYDLIELAKAIVKQYDKRDYWENLSKNRKWADLKEKDLEIIKEAFKPFDNNKYNMKWFINIKQWYKKWNFNWDWNWQNYNNWFNNYKWGNLDWNDFDWDAWNHWYNDYWLKNNKNKNKK